MESPGPAWLRRVVPWMIVIVVAAAYSNSLRNSFIFDDHGSIVTNSNIRQIWPLTVSLAAPPGTGASGRPVTAFSLAVNYALGELNPTGYHLFNIAAHAAAALVLYGLVRRTLESPMVSGVLRAQATPLAAAIALVWAAHPLNTSALNHVVYRNEVLMGLFYLLTLYCVVRGMQRDTAGWFIGGWVACALGMGSKEAMVSAPLAVVIYEYAFGAREALLQRRWWVWLGFCATWVVLAASIASGDRGETVGMGARIAPLPYALTQLGVIAHYLRLAVYPYPLVIDYHDWPIAQSFGDVLAPGVLVLALLSATLVSIVRCPAAGFPALLFFMVLAPTSSFIPLSGATVGEHRMYLPLAAVVIYAVLAVAMLLRGRMREPAMHSVGTGIVPTRLAVAVLPLVLVLSVATYQRNTAFRSEETFYRDVISKRPQNARAQYNLGSALMEQQRFEEAVEPIRTAWRLDPTRGGVLDALMEALSATGRTSEAAECLVDGAVRLSQRADLQLAAARATAGLHRDAEAAQFYRNYLAIRPEDAAIWNELGQQMLRLSRLDEAAECFQAVLRIQPRNWIAMGNLGSIAAQQSRADEALRWYESALEIQPGNPELLYGRIGALSLAGRWPEVVRGLEELIAIRPLPVYMSQLASMLMTEPEIRDIERAIGWSERAVEQTGHRQPEPMRVLARAYASAGRFAEAAGVVRKALELVDVGRDAELGESLRRDLSAYAESRMPDK